MIKDIKDIKDNVKAIVEIAEKTKNTDLKEKILNLKEYVLKLWEENIELKQTLQDIQKMKEYDMNVKNNIYINKNKDGEIEGQYCAICWDSKNKAIRLNKLEDDYYHYQCLVCKNSFFPNNAHKDEETIAFRDSNFP